jgi:CHASE3 domain sensor protein
VALEWFDNRRMAAKLFLGFGAVLALNAVIGIFSLRKLSVVYDSEHDLALRQIPSLRALTDLRSSVNAHRRAQFEYLVARNQSERDECEMHLRDALRAIQSGQEKYQALISSPEEQQGFDVIKINLAEYLDVSQETMNRARARRHRSRRESEKRNRSPSRSTGSRRPSG